MDFCVNQGKPDHPARAVKGTEKWWAQEVDGL